RAVDAIPPQTVCSALQNTRSDGTTNRPHDAAHSHLPTQQYWGGCELLSAPHTAASGDSCDRRRSSSRAGPSQPQSTDYPNASMHEPDNSMRSFPNLYTFFQTPFLALS